MIRPEDEPKINQIALNIRRSKDIACILLVLYNDEFLRQDIEAEIKRRLTPDFSFRELRMTKDMYKNVPVIITREMNPQPNDIFLVYDLKESLPEVLEYLNYRREDFAEHKISVIFWLDEPTLIEIMRKALDFFTFRSSPVIEFMADKSRDIAIPVGTTLGDTDSYDSLEKLDEKIALREEMLNDYLEKLPDDGLAIAGLHMDIGVLYYNKSDLKKAMSHHEKAFKSYKRMKDRKGEANALGNMGNICYSKGELDNALKYYLQALEIDKSIGDIRGEASEFGNIGNVYYSKGELDNALEYYSKAFEIEQRIGNIQGGANALGNMGNLYVDRNDLDKALEAYLQAHEIHKRIGYAQGEASDLGNMGLVYKDKGDLDKALEYMKQSLKIFISINMSMSADIAYENIQEIMELMKEKNIDLSESDAKEIAELTEQYEKLKAKGA